MIKLTKLPVVAAALLIAATMAACSANVLQSKGRVAGQQLPACADKPNCVNSEGDAAHFIEPFSIAGDATAAWQAARAAVANTAATKIVFEQADYLHAEVTSPWGVYTDDLALRLDAQAGLIHVRSSSRLGHYDFGVNRERAEALREALRQALQGEQ